ELPVNVPAISVPGSLMVPVVAARFTVPAPPSATVPGMAMFAAVMPIAVAETVPLIVSSALSVSVTALPPLTKPVTFSALPSFSVRPDAAKLPSVAIWLVVALLPARAAEPLALPDSVPAISVPVSLIVPVLATSETVPEPPSVTVPPMAMLSAVKAIAVAATVPVVMLSRPASVTVRLALLFTRPVIVSALPSFSVSPEALRLLILAIWFAVAVLPGKLADPLALPESVPATRVPVSLIVPVVAISDTVPALPSVTVPAMPILSAVIATAVAITVPVPPTVSRPLSVMFALAPPLTEPAIVSALPSFSVRPAAVKLPSVPIWLAVAVAPARFAESFALPESVPAITVPISLIVPVLAISDTVPAPPSVTVPDMPILSAVNATAFALSPPGTLRSPVSVIVALG